MAVYLKVSGVKNLVKSKGKRCSKDFINALDREVEEVANRALANCKAKTLNDLVKI